MEGRLHIQTLSIFSSCHEQINGEPGPRSRFRKKRQIIFKNKLAEKLKVSQKGSLLPPTDVYSQNWEVYNHIVISLIWTESIICKSLLVDSGGHWETTGSGDCWGRRLKGKKLSVSRGEGPTADKSRERERREGKMRPEWKGSPAADNWRADVATRSERSCTWGYSTTGPQTLTPHYSPPGRPRCVAADCTGRGRGGGERLRQTLFCARLSPIESWLKGSLLAQLDTCTCVCVVAIICLRCCITASVFTDSSCFTLSSPSHHRINLLEYNEPFIFDLCFHHILALNDSNILLISFCLPSLITLLWSKPWNYCCLFSFLVHIDHHMIILIIFIFMFRVKEIVIVISEITPL